MAYEKKSESNARKMLRRYVDKAGVNLGRRIEAVIIVGSLSTRSYVPGPGCDIDQITIIDDKSSENTFECVLQLLEDTENTFGFEIPFSRTVYWRKELERPFRTDFEFTPQNKRLVEVPIELMRIHESGEVLLGNKSIVSVLPLPTRGEVVLFDQLSRQWSDSIRLQDPKLQRNVRELPARISVQVLLTNAFRHYYYATGKVCSNKLQIACRMKTDVPGYLFQDALDLAADFKANACSVFNSTQTDYLVQQAEFLSHWKETHPVDAVPLKERHA